MYPCLNPGTLGWNISLERLIEVASSAGFRGIEFGVQGLRDTAQKLGSDELKKILTKANIELSAFSLPLDIRADEATFNKSLSDLEDLTQWARSFGCRTAVTWIEPGTDDEPVMKVLTLVKRLRTIARLLARQETRLAVELVGPHGRKGRSHRFIDSIEAVLNLVQTVDENNVGLLLDSIHWHTASGIKDSILALPDGIIYMVHIDDVPAGSPMDCEDGMRLLPGEGAINLSHFIAALREYGYTGPVSVESMNRNRKFNSDQELQEYATLACESVLKFI